MNILLMLGKTKIEKNQEITVNLVKTGKSGNIYKIVIFYPFYMQIGHNTYFVERFRKM